MRACQSISPARMQLSMSTSQSLCACESSAPWAIAVEVVTVLVMMMALTPLAQDRAWQESRLVGYFSLLSDWATGGLGGAAGEIGA